VAFYRSVIQRRYSEFKTISRINKTGCTRTPEEAKDALFAMPVHKAGTDEINDCINDLRAAKVFRDPKYYSRLKAEPNRIVEMPDAKKSDLIKEPETAMFDMERYAR
jgi:hypothetical protein